jgi:hypothetical protein
VTIGDESMTSDLEGGGIELTAQNNDNISAITNNNKPETD